MDALLGEPGATTHRLTNVPGVTFLRPRYKPDSSEILIQGNIGSTVAAFIINADGTNLRQFTAFPIEAIGNDWSPDGLKITFSDFVINDISDNFIADAPGLGPITPITRDDAQRITQEGSGNNTRSKFSPDGQALVYQTEPCVPVGACLFREDIFTTNLSGTVLNNITPNGTLYDDQQPEWQPINYDFSGFMPPIDALPAYNVIKASQAVPIKFSLSGFHTMGIFAAGYPKSEEIAQSQSL